MPRAPRDLQAGFCYHSELVHRQVLQPHPPPQWALLGETLPQFRFSGHRPAACPQYLMLHPCQPQGGGCALGGYFYDFSNYGSYDQLTDDGLTQWHPAFLELGAP
jgi:hypothetical protein